MKRLKISTDVKIIKTKEIDTIEFRLIYPIKQNNDNRYYIALLSLLLTSYNRFYPNAGEFKKQLLKKTILDMNLSSTTIVDNTYLIYSFCLPKEGLIKDFDLEESFKFAIDTLFNPCVENDAFNKANFDYEKNYLYSTYESRLHGIYAANSNAFYEFIDPTDELGNSYKKDGEILSSITPESLYSFYQKYLKEGAFISYVYGDVSESKIRRLFKKYLPQEKDYISFNINYFKLLPIAKRTYKEVTTHYNQSELFLEFQVDMQESEVKYLSTLINILMGQENNLVFEALRVKHSLVYDVKVSSSSSRGMFVIIAFIASDKYKETKAIIKDIFKELKNPEYLKKCYDKLLKGIEVDILKEQDGQGYLLSKTTEEDLKIVTTEELLKRTKSINIDDLAAFIGRVKITNEMFFRGVSND